MLTFFTFSLLLTIRLSRISRLKTLLGSKEWVGKIHCFKSYNLPISHSARTTLHVTLSEAQRQFPKAIQALASSVSPVTFSLSLLYSESIGRGEVGQGGWGDSVLEVDGIHTSGRNFLCFTNTGFTFHFLFWLWGTEEEMLFC